MGRIERLRLASRICYYLGVLGIVILVVGHVARFFPVMERTINVSSVNILQGTLLLLLLCLASEIRAFSLASVTQAPAAKA